ncbi:SHOCT domain-containing protein [Oenococcus oeni]|uniref:SHOCT domain-containing protein n=6 Tax=Oenococcus oeni TaxID=1247 RepID=UPI0002777732|nr:SHOCT domain-containing protein [Oenococcus oeni]EJN93089.1 hypothetical protein AWRIB304_13 [Oenococcus oeni AWRIB304]EJO02391.1 putative phage protein [Oenococcus oeni AWRIB318]KER91157.1 hypothetical protein HS16_03580 [Oenococcus oeni]KER96631.1 hypothetical protein HT64_02585 [Oenococcus oeni]KGH60523.1 hypothetical protein X467_06155 [Oenococcus oeni S28]
MFFDKEKHLKNKEKRQNEKQEYENILQSFEKTSSLESEKIIFSDKRNEVLIKKTLLGKRYFVYPYKEIIGYKPIINGKSIKKHHGITRAIVGGALLGGAGAIVGAVTGGKQYDVVDKLAISIFFKDNKQFEMIFLNSETKTDSFTYKTLQESFNLLANKLESIISINNANVTDSKKVSDADEISKFKALLDEGTITKGEFDAKKKQILGL